nr:hypothetical protein [Tanacetum cinerariifolium]
VIDLEKTKITQRNEIDRLKKSVKKFEKRNRSRTHKLKRLYKGRRMDAIDADEDITLVNDANNEMFDVDDLGGEEVFVAWKNENVVAEIVDAAQDNDKGIMIEEHVKPKKKDQIRLDKEVALKL